MKELNKAFSAVLPGGRAIRVLLPLAFGLCLLAAGSALAQEQPVQTAARARVPASPGAQRPISTVSANPSLASLVSFEGGQLSINATNVTLADVLFAVRGATGADIDIPMNASSERVTAQLGPGPARKVLADLLAWSSFDYIIQGFDDDPLAVQSITLMVRVKSSMPVSNTAVTAAAGLRQALPSRPESDAAPAGISAAPEGAVVETRPDLPAASATATAGPSTDAPDAPSGSQPKVPPPASQPWGGGASAAGRSPSDMIQELQQMYQQRRMLQEQQNQASGQRAP